MKKYELEQRMGEIYTSRRKTAELQETYDCYSDIVAQAEEFFWQDGYQSHYALRFEMTLDLTSRHRHYSIEETDEALAELKKQEDDPGDVLVDLLREEAQDEH